MKFHWDLDQNSEEWLDLRRGRISGSDAAKLLVKGKGEQGFGVGALSLARKIAEEVVTGRVRQSFSNKATDWGHEYEPEAIAYYEIESLTKVQRVGYVEKDQWRGVSPDGLITEVPIYLEYKCLPVDHIAIVESNEPDPEHVKQVQWGLWCTQYPAAHLVYYHPWYPKKTRMKVFRIEPDKELHGLYEDRSGDLITLTENIIKRLT
jgi:hypothetical protein